MNDYKNGCIHPQVNEHKLPGHVFVAERAQGQPPSITTQDVVSIFNRRKSRQHGEQAWKCTRRDPKARAIRESFLEVEGQKPGPEG